MSSNTNRKSSDSAAIAARLTTHHIRLLRVLSDLAAKQTPLTVPMFHPTTGKRQGVEGFVTAQLVSAGLVSREIAGSNYIYRLTTKGQDVYGQVVAATVSAAQSGGRGRVIGR